VTAFTDPAEAQEAADRPISWDDFMVDVIVFVLFIFLAGGAAYAWIFG
jgi:hypothetical protein